MVLTPARRRAPHLCRRRSPSAGAPDAGDGEGGRASGGGGGGDDSDGGGRHGRRRGGSDSPVNGDD
jgi:hypothetical protein